MVRFGISFVLHSITDIRDWADDRRTGYNTVSERWGSPPEVSHHDAVRYDKSARKDFQELMTDLQLSPAKFTFIDLGCGKGAALLFALERGFDSVIGVEFDPKLVYIAKKNLEKFISAKQLGRGFRVIQIDAANFDFPVSRSVVYLYNPFGVGTLRAVLRRLESSLVASPREVMVAYLNPVHRTELDNCSSLSPLPSSSQKWAIYQNLAVAGGAER
jgi:SAM-dependent methyltransferase